MFDRLYDAACDLTWAVGVFTVTRAHRALRWIDRHCPVQGDDQSHVKITVAGDPERGRTYIDIPA